MTRRQEPLLTAWSNEVAEAKAARNRGDFAGEWSRLERAHILSQPMIMPHIQTHVAMLAYGIRRRDGREVAGQLIRLILAGPGSLTGRYPVGNTGGAKVSAFLPMSVPDDLLALIQNDQSMEAAQ